MSLRHWRRHAAWETAGTARRATASPPRCPLGGLAVGRSAGMPLRCGASRNAAGCAVGAASESRTASAKGSGFAKATALERAAFSSSGAR